jgi:transposase InsO family protein
MNHIHRIVTDNGACYRCGDFARTVGNKTRHQRKVELYQRILAEELLYAREFTSEDARTAAIAVWNIHYNYHRPHSATDGQPPASRLKLAVTNVQPSYN